MSLLSSVKLTLYCLVHVKFAQVIIGRFTRFAYFSCCSLFVPVCESIAGQLLVYSWTAPPRVHIGVAHDVMFYWTNNYADPSASVYLTYVMNTGCMYHCGICHSAFSCFRTEIGIRNELSCFSFLDIALLAFGFRCLCVQQVSGSWFYVMVIDNWLYVLLLYCYWFPPGASSLYLFQL